MLGTKDTRSFPICAARRVGSRGPQWLGALVQFAGACRGVAALEFALLAPVFILLYVGAGEVSQAVMTSRKVEALSRTLADLVSQQPTSNQTSSAPAPANATTQAILQTILGASTAIMAPSSLSSLKMTISAVDIVNNAQNMCCSFKVRWSYTQSGTLRPCNVNLTPVSPTQKPSPTTVSWDMVPPVPQLPNPVPLLIADVSYTYQGPFSSQWIDFSGGMTRTSYMFPRTTGQVIATAPLTPTSNQSGSVCY